MSSYIYTNGSVAVLTTKLLSQEKLSRMAESDSVDEALKVLFESGYADGTAMTAADFESVLAEQTKQAAEFVKQNSPEPASTDCFLLQTDYRNAKIAMKSKYARKEPQYLTEGGTLDASALSSKIITDDYGDFSAEMAEALEEIDKKFYEGNRKPALIDVTLDKAYYKQVARLLKKSKSKSVINYFAADADMKNILNFFRVKRAGLDKEYLLNLLLDSVKLSKDFFERIFDGDFERIQEEFDGTGYGEFVSCILEEYNGGTAFAKSEALALNCKKNLIAPDRHNNDGIEPLVNYYLAKQTEAENIRLILVCLKNCVRKEEIEKRLRESYV